MDQYEKIKDGFKYYVMEFLGYNIDTYLNEYFSYKKKFLPNCKSCKEKYFVKESGLTKENIKIYHYFLERWNLNKNKYCMGCNNGFYCLCYNRNLIPVISNIYRNVFSKMANISYTITKYGLEKYNLNIYKTEKEIETFWNNVDNSISAFINVILHKTIKHVEDYIIIKSRNGLQIYLHGHQLKDFLQGKRIEQKYLGGKKISKTIEFISLGHLHKLSIHTFSGFNGVICFNGSSLFPKNSIWFPELISNNGQIAYGNDNYRPYFEINRLPFTNIEMENVIYYNKKNPRTYEQKIQGFRRMIKPFSIMLPGNHDMFNEVYIRKNFNDSLMGGIALGDYCEFDITEKEKATKECLGILREEGFITLSEFKEQ